MKMNIKKHLRCSGKLTLLSIMIVLCLFACSEDPQEVNQNPFEGLWTLHIMEQKDSLGNWQEWRDGMNGYILYDAVDNMSVHLTVEGYEHSELEFPNFDKEIPIEALKHLTGSYVYFAKYSVDTEKGTVQHARFSHSNPRDWDVVVQRRFTFTGDTLILQPVENENANLRLKWVRVKE
jgi:hypothetical protein